MFIKHSSIIDRHCVFYELHRSYTFEEVWQVNNEEFLCTRGKREVRAGEKARVAFANKLFDFENDITIGYIARVLTG